MGERWRPGPACWGPKRVGYAWYYVRSQGLSLKRSARCCLAGTSAGWARSQRHKRACPGRRGYTHQRYRRIIESIRRHMPDASVSGDAIVGFPGARACSGRTGGVCMCSTHGPQLSGQARKACRRRRQRPTRRGAPGALASPPARPPPRPRPRPRHGAPAAWRGARMPRARAAQRGLAGPRARLARTAPPAGARARRTPSIRRLRAAAQARRRSSSRPPATWCARWASTASTPPPTRRARPRRPPSGTTRRAGGAATADARPRPPRAPLRCLRRVGFARGAAHGRRPAAQDRQAGCALRTLMLHGQVLCIRSSRLLGGCDEAPALGPRRALGCTAPGCAARASCSKGVQLGGGGARAGGGARRWPTW